MNGDGVESAVLGKLCEIDADDVLVVPSHAEFTVKGMVTGARMALKMVSNQAVDDELVQEIFERSDESASGTSTALLEVKRSFSRKMGDSKK